MTTKCKRCKVEKPLNDKGRCEGCEKYLKDYYEEHRQESIARATKSQKKNRFKTKEYKRELNRKNPVGYLLQRVRSRAKLEGIPFDLTKDDICIPSHCPILNVPLQVNDWKVGPNSISVDRIVPELGYVKGNIAIISHRANTIKSNASIEELERVVEWLKEKTNE